MGGFDLHRSRPNLREGLRALRGVAVGIVAWINALVAGIAYPLSLLGLFTPLGPRLVGVGASAFAFLVATAALLTFLALLRQAPSDFKRAAIGSYAVNAIVFAAAWAVRVNTSGEPLSVAPPSLIALMAFAAVNNLTVVVKQLHDVPDHPRRSA